MTVHYLDNAATTKPCKAAVDAAMRCLTECYGNPSSLHRAGVDAQKECDHARAVIASALGCDARELIFTSCATESTNTALRSTAAAYGRRRKRIVTSAVEHASVKKTLAFLAENEGFEITEVKPDPETNEYKAVDFLAACDDDTVMITMMMVNNETGHILPVKEAFAMVKRKYPHIVTHCDAVQAFMKFPVKAKQLNADFISVSGHKVHAPKGIGVLYAKKGMKLRSLILGGKQERGLRAGTECVPLIAAFGAAVESLAGKISENTEYVKSLNTSLREKLTDIGVKIISPETASPYVLSITVPPIRSEIMLHFLEARGIYVSSGSACSKGAGSGVPETFGVSDKEADSILRISLCAENTQDDIDALVQGIADGQKEIMHS